MVNIPEMLDKKSLKDLLVCSKIHKVLKLY